MSKPCILIVEDQRALRESLKNWLRAWHEVDTASSGEQGVAAIEERHFDLVLLDQRLPGMSGFDVLRHVARHHPELPVVMMTAFGSVDQAVDAIKEGAEDYLLKPIDLDTLQRRIERILHLRALAAENLRLKEQLEDKWSFHDIITRDAQMVDLCSRVEAVAHTDAPVLITGESGTGKELVARALHQASDRATRPFVAVACGAVPDALMESELFGHEKGAFTGADSRRIGRFEEAADGTILLDELGELSGMAQVKLLRVLQQRELQRLGGSGVLPLRARIVSATNRNLEEAIELGEFRQDLFYRINTVRVELPPLRNRAGDIPLLADHFLRRFAKHYHKSPQLELHPDALRSLQRHRWPGNVRELRACIENAVILCRDKVIVASDLPIRRDGEQPSNEPPKTFHQQMYDHGRKTVLQALDDAAGVKGQAAERLGLSQRALSHYLNKYGIR